MSRTRFVLWMMVLSLLLCSAPLRADDEEPMEPASWPEATEPDAEQVRPIDRVRDQMAVREGFTAHVAAGVGFQANNPDNRPALKEFGLAGLNFGFGSFINPSIAILARASTTFVFPHNDTYKSFSMAGALTAAAQWWPLDRLHFEVGAGLGYQFLEVQEGTQYITDHRYGFGMLLAIGVPFWQRGMSSVFVGADYAPLFIEDGPVHCVSITLGWQLL